MRVKEGRADMVRKQAKQKAKNVTELNNDYVRTLQQKEERKRAQKVRLRRRLAVFAGVAIVLFAIQGKIFFNQNKILAQKEEEKQVLLSQLADVEDEHLMLTRQLEKLNDDEYIAKLARQKYFLSEGNETIFSIPPKEEKVEKKEQEKE